jgi:chromosome segregation protein
MSAPARLLSIRLVGFKSFAEKTEIEFGPGISAIVGPNGSGKSNLADALRWTFGEQGRNLRTRRAEDVIFAGSQTRRPTGMADVTVLLDNVDGCFPLDYSQVALGRRLFRSGENEYLLNRQRVRYRDILEVLEAGRLARGWSTRPCRCGQKNDASFSRKSPGYDLMIAAAARPRSDWPRPRRT